MNKPNIRFQRANYIVANMERALEFYVGVLGLTLDFEKDSEKTSYSYPVFAIPNEANIRFAVLSAPNQPRVMALTEITNLKTAPVPHPRRAAIVLEMPEVESVAKCAKDAANRLHTEGSSSLRLSPSSEAQRPVPRGGWQQSQAR